MNNPPPPDGYVHDPTGTIAVRFWAAALQIVVLYFEFTGSVKFVVSTGKETASDVYNAMVGEFQVVPKAYQDHLRLMTCSTMTSTVRWHALGKEGLTCASLFAAHKATVKTSTRT